MRTLYRSLAIISLVASLVGTGSPSQALTINKTVGMPKSLSATASSQSVLLKWTKATSSIKAKITGYQVTITSGTWRSVKTASAAASSYRVSGLTNSKTYRFIVQSISGKYLSSPLSILATPPNATAIEFD